MEDAFELGVDVGAECAEVRDGIEDVAARLHAGGAPEEVFAQQDFGQDDAEREEVGRPS